MLERVTLYMYTVLYLLKNKSNVSITEQFHISK